MPKFSIIVPVYNVEKYIKKSLDSILNQSFKDYEVIVVNDGTKDNSIELIKDYPVKIINQKNQGLSVARNTGVKHATGEYIIFIDSDDWIEKDLLKKLNKSSSDSPDLIRFQIQEVYEDGKTIKFNELPFEHKNGPDAFEEIVKYHFVENAWCYAIKKEYYEKEKFEFKKGTIHEDFGLIPLVIMKSNKVNSISYIGYNYLQRQGSIMNNVDYEKTIKKVSDMFTHYKYLISEINKTKLNSKTFRSYAANSIILKICELNKKEYKEYLNILKKQEVFDNLLVDNLPRRIKRCLLKISPKIYYKVKKISLII